MNTNQRFHRNAKRIPSLAITIAPTSPSAALEGQRYILPGILLASRKRSVRNVFWCFSRNPTPETRNPASHICSHAVPSYITRFKPLCFFSTSHLIADI